jgi:RimJ/RimL family protein N-acetyltransferase
MIETDRLLVIPLNAQELMLYVQANGKLERRLQLTDSGRTVSGTVKETMEAFTLPKMKRAKGDGFLFYTVWIVVEKRRRLIVGELGFKGEPGPKHEVEIGYGTLYSHRGNGFMTEAVGGIVSWSRKRTEICSILAEVDETNLPSIRVMEKNAFRMFEKKRNMLWWRFDFIREEVQDPERVI